ncbi:MAG: TorF family putative porin [Halioglobus sp.]|nr:TorF family putative porin [Halioglobus sp.]
MLNKKLVSTAVGTALLAGIGATSVQAFDLSANVALVSDYRFRGITQTDTNAAIQGGFDASFEPGFYIGTWASSVDFGDVDDGSGSYGTMEIDYYAGWSGPIGDTDFGIDVGYYYYQYPGDTVDPKGDYEEFNVTGSWKDLSIGVTYSDDFYAKTGEYWYYAGDYSLTFAEDFSVAFHAGYNDFEDVGFFATTEDSYTDYSITLGYTFKGVDFSVAWVGTDLDDDDCWNTNYCDDTAVFSISKSL